MDLPYLSLVIPAYNEQENVPTLLKRVEESLTPIGRPFGGMNAFAVQPDQLVEGAKQNGRNGRRSRSEKRAVSRTQG